MQYKILASDYDNTLVPFGENQPRPAMVKAVKKLQAAEGKFVLSTGRAWSAINRKGQLGGIRFDYAITCNGACVVDKNGAIMAEHPMTNEEMYALVDFCEDYNYPLQFDFKDAYYAYCEYDILHKYYDQMNSVGLDCVDGEDQDRHLIDMPHAAFCIFPEGALERAMTQVSEKALKRRANKNVILALSSTLVWFIALFVFVIMSSFHAVERYSWLAFFYAVPINAIVMLSLLSAWHDFRKNRLLISAIVWGFLIAIHVSGLLIFRYNFWKIYLLGIPGQIAIFLWFRMFHPVSEKAEGTDNG